MALGNCIQAYTTLHFTSQVYNGPASSSSPPGSKSPRAEVTHLQSRTFGTWTLLASIIRIYAAYNISDPVMYQIALWTYVIAWAHFMSEWLVFGTTQWGRGLAGPIFVANLSVGWMFTQWGFYVQ